MGPTTRTIEADDRECAGGVVDALAAHPQVAVAVGRLSLGDYLPGGGVVVERQSAADLVVSIRDRHRFDQVGRRRAGVPARCSSWGATRSPCYGQRACASLGAGSGILVF
jgi:hypothetical protein